MYYTNLLKKYEKQLNVITGAVAVIEKEADGRTVEDEALL